MCLHKRGAVDVDAVGVVEGLLVELFLCTYVGKISSIER